MSSRIRGTRSVHDGAAVHAATEELASARATDTVVEAPAGAMRGTLENGIRVFKGISYALPPIGERRWKPPVAVPPWQDTRDCLRFGPACPQPKRLPGSIYDFGATAMDEDCLSLNIWAPHDAEGAPVLVWIHGGSLIWGAARNPMYDGARLASRGIIVVSINYRLGVLGYLAHPELSAESPDGVSGNYGLLDQVAALAWVKSNIAAFGGDPAAVTVMGESAGALSVLYLMASPAARGLFVRAIAQSAYMISTPALRERQHGEETAESAGETLAAALGAPDIAALRKMDAARLVTAAAAAGFSPSGTVDGHFLPRQLVDTFDRGEQAPVPLMAGYNSGEIRSLRFLAATPPGSRAAYEADISARYGDCAGEFLSLYPAADIEESILAATRDAMYGWTAERLAARQAALGLPAYLYLFDHSWDAATKADLDGFHAGEIPYIFGTRDRTPPLWPQVPDTAGEADFSDAMLSYWASFAASGKPSADGAAPWPAYGADGAFMHFAETPRTGTLDRRPFTLHEEVVRRRRAHGNQPWNWNVGVAAPPLPAGDARDSQSTTVGDI